MTRANKKLMEGNINSVNEDALDVLDDGRTKGKF